MRILKKVIKILRSQNSDQSKYFDNDKIQIAATNLSLLRVISSINNTIYSGSPSFNSWVDCYPLSYAGNSSVFIPCFNIRDCLPKKSPKSQINYCCLRGLQYCSGWISNNYRCVSIPRQSQYIYTPFTSCESHGIYSAIFYGSSLYVWY